MFNSFISFDFFKSKDCPNTDLSSKTRFSLIENDLKCRTDSKEIRVEPIVSQLLSKTQITSNSSQSVLRVCDDSDKTLKEMKNNENESEDTEPMTDTNVLRQRVISELERIEVWKSTTEMEMKSINEENKRIKQMNRQLRQRIDSIQMENSSLKSELESETSERDAVLAKMSITEQMFAKVCDYVEKIEDKLNVVNNFKNSAQYLAELRAQECDRLTKEFGRLEVENEERFKEYRDEINTRVKEHIRFSEATFDLYQELEQKKNELEMKTNSHNKELNKSLNENQSLSDIIDVLRNQMIEKETQIDCLTKNLDQLKQKYEDLKDSNESEIRNFEVKAQQLLESRVEVEKDLKILRDEHQVINEKKTECEKRFTEMNTFLEKTTYEKQESEKCVQELTSKMESLLIECQTFRANAENDKKELSEIIDEKQVTIECLKSDVELLNDKTIELSKLNDQNQTLIENLETKVNESFTEKEDIEKQLKQEINSLKREIESKDNEMSEQIRNLEVCLEELKIEYDLKIQEFQSKEEGLKIEKQNLEKDLDSRKRSLETQIEKMTQILETCKCDYNKRIEEKEVRIKEYKIENEKIKFNVELLQKRLDKAETEKANISRRLQKLTYSAMEATHCSPVRVSTPKVMSPVESQRVNTSWGSTRDYVMPEPVLSNSPLKQTRSDTKAKQSQRMQNKSESNSKKILNDDSSESVYELLGTKLEKINKQKNENMKTKAKKSVKMDMSSKGADDGNTDTTGSEPMPKKMKTFGLKTYSKQNIRVENILKGKPTPTKDNDLSWLDF